MLDKSLLKGTYELPPEKPEKRVARSRPQRYSISVAGVTYRRLHQVVTSASLQKFVDQILVSALDDEKILARVVERCRAAKSGRGLVQESGRGLVQESGRGLGT